MGSAAAEVMRTRADKEVDSDKGEAYRQIKAMRKELEAVKQEARKAKEEAAKAIEEADTLRRELVEIRGKRGTRERGRARIRDSSPSPSPSPLIPHTRRDKKRCGADGTYGGSGSTNGTSRDPYGSGHSHGG